MGRSTRSVSRWSIDLNLGAQNGYSTAASAHHSHATVVMTSRTTFDHNRLWRLAFLCAALAFFVGGAWTSPSTGQEHPMPDGPGKEEARKFCAGCHELAKSFSM